MRSLAVATVILVSCTRSEPVKETPPPTSAPVAPSPSPASTSAQLACPHLTPDDCPLFAKLGDRTAARVGAYRSQLGAKSPGEILALRREADSLRDLLEDFDQEELASAGIIDRMSANTPGVR